MPVIVNATEPHLFLPSLGDPTAIADERAIHQDIRPMEIAIINLMADKQATERQLAQWLGHTPLQIRLTFAATDNYVKDVRQGREPKNTPAEHIRKFYSAWSDIKHRKFDGLIITGVNALKETVTAEEFWPEIKEILEWSNTNALSSLYLCWGAKAALRHFHNIESDKAARKIFGLYPHRLVSDKTNVLIGFPDVFSVPISRWKNPRRDDIYMCKALEVVADCDDTGPNIMVEAGRYDENKVFPRRLYILNHPEYETDTLKREYLRDKAMQPKWPLPRYYFPDDDVNQEPINIWRFTANIYVNWVRSIYEATPFDINQIPQPWQRSPVALRAAG